MSRRGVLVVVLLVLAAAVGGVSAQALTERPAELDVTQPAWVDSDVRADTSGNLTTYHAQGERLYLTPTNFNESAVTGYGVATAGDASLGYDETLDAFVLRPGADGTYEVYFETRETREIVANNTTETRDVTVRYSARVNVSGTGAQVVSAGALERQNEAAENWRNFNATLHDPQVGGDRPTGELTQLAIDLVRVRLHPASVFTGQVSATLTVLFLTLGGLIIVGVAGALHFVARWLDIRDRRKQQTLDAERADLSEMVDNLRDLQQEEHLSKWDWNRWMPDADARAFREALGESPLKGYRRLLYLFSPRTMLRDRLGQMGQAGYVAVVDERRATDGGDGTSAAEPASATLYPQGQTPTDVPPEDVIDLADLSDGGGALECDVDALVEAISGEDPEVRAFDPIRAGVDPSAVATDIRAPDIDELIEEYEVALQRDFGGDKGLYLRYMAEFVRSVEQSPYADRDGRPDTVQQTMQVLMDLTDQLRDREDIPLADWLGDAFELMEADYDRVDDIESYVEDVRTGEVDR